MPYFRRGYGRIPVSIAISAMCSLLKFEAIGARDTVVQISLLRGRCDQRQSSFKIDDRGRYWNLRHNFASKYRFIPLNYIFFLFCCTSNITKKWQMQELLSHYNCRICHIGLIKVYTIIDSQKLKYESIKFQTLSFNLKPSSR